MTALPRRQFLKVAATAGASVLVSSAWSATSAPVFAFDPRKHIIPAPSDPALWPEFRRQLASWREATRRALSYSDALYRRPDFAWVARNFSCCFLMLCDETFYDGRTGGYTVKRFLADGERDFGGYDSIVLWHAYPRIGLDARNQFDFYRDLPGGLKGLRGAVDQMHQAGVRAFLDYNPWDTGTRREGRSDLDALCDLVRELDADGLFLDTMDRGAAEFRTLLDGARPGVALEGEIALPLDRVHDHHLSWAQWFEDSAAPGVLRNKWFERRHLQHQIKRWDQDHTGELHAAWMNGSGMMVWENVFGSWVGWSPRDRSMLRAMLPIQRRFAGVFCGEGWCPLVPTLAPAVFASLWEGSAMLASGFPASLRLWTLVNRGHAALEGPLLVINLPAGEKVYDLVRGVEVTPASGPAGAVLHGTIPPRGIGCFVAARPEALGRGFRGFLGQQRATHARASLDPASPKRSTRLVVVKPARRLPCAPEGMAEIPAASLEIVVEVRERECGFYESSPPEARGLANAYNFHTRSFRRAIRFERFAMDLTPVTNAEFADFLRASHYRPRHPEHFLQHWRRGAPPAGLEDHPVVCVDLDDARAYARWAHKRLPTEEEWQYAAQGPEARQYPWGNEMLSGHCNGGETGTTTPVRAFPAGRSCFGLYDLCGNVWEWTESERSDGRTRFCMIRGGSFYTARGSNWYMDGGPRPVNFSEKFLRMWPGLDRCATVGFRCVCDLA
jgi:formylglycine-generating enzyme required for sulfatase activity